MTDTAKKSVSASQEDYLEAILKLESSRGSARVRDLASELSVHKSTVTAALRALADRGFVNHSPYELTTLTEDGRRIAEQVSRRHAILKQFLTDVLLVDDEAAARNACRMEHVTDRLVMDRLRLLAQFAALSGRRPGKAWPRRFAEFITEQNVSREGGGAQTRQPMESAI
jgi:DtxR family Mn-dependent transcriptional regulator